MDTKKYDVAFSFAGEDREVVEFLARQLKQKGVRVFYDSYEQADLWGKDLYQHFNYVYRDSAKYCVVVISENYVRKLWPKHELRQAQARAFEEGIEYVLPVRLDDSELPGVNKTQGYLDLRRIPLQMVVDLLVAKLRDDSTEVKLIEDYPPPLNNYALEIEAAQEWKAFYVVRRYERIPLGKEKNARDHRFKECPDCGVKRGQFHTIHCDWEECPICHGQAWTCGCIESRRKDWFGRGAPEA